ncbi:ribosome small subunit-dependent GTPase A [Magnetospira sp. QH-2]|uniref:ribosome small subunit-dependent GTPase A n=1 Tax=Magnetospira sp. (strain QH-2) TaxID=1288970 RepID=UPI0018E07C8A|nr:ribosome small subunit-dependent GTPase A [Magnetospira sp. QH-2]
MAVTPPVRITEGHRAGHHIVGQDIDTRLPPMADATVGDWLLYNRERPGSSRLLERKSLFKRRAPGTDRKIQLIAANIDTAFIVSSCNHDFNIARLERYMALAFEAQVVPVIVLTKADLCEIADDYRARAEAIANRVPVRILDARGGSPKAVLAEWCAPGQTLAFLGSSGVGKSTLINGLSGNGAIATQGIREDDSKGRHTTTRRHLHVLPNGCTALDTPGMRELQLTDAKEGVGDVFSDLRDLSEHCRFNDCQHETEPGCAILKAIETGAVDGDRLARWRKLVREERFNASSLAERKRKDRQLGKMIRQVQLQKRQ